MTDFREANSEKSWNNIWTSPAKRDWRKEVLSSVYERIVQLIPRGSRVIDIGGGVGFLAELLSENGVSVEIWDISTKAIKLASKKGFKGRVVNLEKCIPEWDENTIIVATEVLEHLSEETRNTILARTKRGFFSVPNNRLGPEEESQHTVKFTALSFLNSLRQTHQNKCRVEVIKQHFLLGVVGIEKKFTLSVTMPVRDEAADLEKTLASFRGVADEMVIGIDPRTVDNTREIAERYAEVVFDIEDPESNGAVAEGGVHFSHIRNQCIDKCSSEWVFMTEGHEWLKAGQDSLLKLDRLIPAHVKVVLVLRTGDGQQWGFPWLFKKNPENRFTRATHNILDFPSDSFVVHLAQVKTLHERTLSRGLQRAKQRRVQNRKSLFEDWFRNANETSLYYLATEWREFDLNRSIYHFEQFLALPRHNGPMRYQARLILAKEYVNIEEYDKARQVLLGCAEEDWCRTDHWIWLGDLAFSRGSYEEALQFYKYSSSRIGDPPFTLWWIDLFFYGHLPAQRLAMTFSALGRYKEALGWAKKVLELLPEDLPLEVAEECERNIKTLEGVLEEENVSGN